MAQFSHRISSCEILISASLPEVIWLSSSKNKIFKNKCKCPHRNCVAVPRMCDFKMIQNVSVNLSEHRWDATQTLKNSFMRHLSMGSSLKNHDDGSWFPSIQCVESGPDPWRILRYKKTVVLKSSLKSTQKLYPQHLSLDPQHIPTFLFL